MHGSSANSPDKTPANNTILSKRQTQMLTALASGMRYKEIAYKYNISENTVAFHIAELRKKLKVRNSREIISAAFKLGLLETL